MKILKSIRLERGLLQKDVAKQIGIQQSTYAKYEVEPRMPSAEILKMLSAFYDFPLDYMIFNADAELSPEEVRAIRDMHLEISDEDVQIRSVKAYASQLNASGLQRLEEYAQLLCESGKYQKKPLHPAPSGD